ncbi:o-succinylbenzoate synthase [Candidatus Bipolaricaulota bacterium]|nr:o-succinylbenzoate synthase [Candidatus Bipolaricaulota bacterium]
MRIERATLYLVEMPLVAPFVTSFGEQRVRRALLVALESGGRTGWGECVAGTGPWYSPETSDTARHVILDFVLPLLKGREIGHPSEFPALVAPIRGHAMAKAAVEAALWDLHAQREGVPLAALLGGTRDRVPAGVSVGIQPDVETLVSRVAGYVGEGYRRVKLKVKPGWDLEPLAAVRERFPDLPLSVDANAAYALADAAHLREFDRFGLLMVEQPLAHDDLVGHAQLAEALRTPLCLDESITSPGRAWEALELGACRILNVKQGRLGGLSAVLEVHELAQERGVPLWCGGMLETGIGRALNAAVASLPGFTLPHDISATDRYYREDIATPPFRLEDGHIRVPTRPGLGVEVDLARLQRYAVAMWAWRPRGGTDDEG